MNTYRHCLFCYLAAGYKKRFICMLGKREDELKFKHCFIWKYGFFFLPVPFNKNGLSTEDDYLSHFNGSSQIFSPGVPSFFTVMSNPPLFLRLRQNRAATVLLTAAHGSCSAETQLHHTASSTFFYISFCRLMLS